MNPNLVTIKIVLFLFFGGVGVLCLFIPLHLQAVGLNISESKLVALICPIVALLGPLLTCYLADKLAQAGNNGGIAARQKTGRSLRVIIAVCLVSSAIFYLLLCFLVPPIARLEARKPAVILTCDESGGEILQERCTEGKKCYDWKNDKLGSLQLNQCAYSCRRANQFEDELFLHPDLYFNETNPEETEDRSENDNNQSEYEDQEEYFRDKRETIQELEPPPHLCYKEVNGESVCQVYTLYSKEVTVNITLNNSVNPDAEQEPWCRYPIGNDFACRISQKITQYLKEHMNASCTPVVECFVDDPYSSPNSVLADTQCLQTVGDPTLTLILYIVFRSLADLFALSSLALLSGAVITATRETSTGRGNVGIQLAWGAIGFVVFVIISWGILKIFLPVYALEAFAVLYSLAAIGAAGVILASHHMPLSPPEWWWHTSCGMLAVPMSALKRFRAEVGALFFVLVLFGMVWSALQFYLPWSWHGQEWQVELALWQGAILAIPVLWNAEELIDYCGHSNILITAFIFYGIRYGVFCFTKDPEVTFVFNIANVMAVVSVWVTSILYFRHLIVRKYTLTGQALVVVAFLCLGRFFGAVVGSIPEEMFNFSKNSQVSDSLKYLYQLLAAISTIIAVVYFIVYHLFLKPSISKQGGISSPKRLPTITGLNGNGNYTPLRVYHNWGAKKGQFRY